MTHSSAMLSTRQTFSDIDSDSDAGGVWLQPPRSHFGDKDTESVVSSSSFAESVATGFRGGQYALASENTPFAASWTSCSLDDVPYKNRSTTSSIFGTEAGQSNNTGWTKIGKPKQDAVTKAMTKVERELRREEEEREQGGHADDSDDDDEDPY